MTFIIPAQPNLRTFPPRGDKWIHEVKFDGWRIQLHKNRRDVAVYTKNGHNYASAFGSIAASVAAIPVSSCIIDGELTACDEYGLPNFHALHFRRAKNHFCVWAFDLLQLNSKDTRDIPLHDRKSLLERLVCKTADQRLRFSESFD